MESETERLAPEATVERRAAEQSGGDALKNSDGSNAAHAPENDRVRRVDRADAVNAARSEESEVIFREAIEMCAVEIIELDADALELRKIKALRDLGAEVGVILLIRVELRQDSPRFPLRALVVIVKSAEGVTPPRIRTVDARADLERVARNGERCRRVLIAHVRRVRQTKRHVDLAEIQERVAGA